MKNKIMKNKRFYWLLFRYLLLILIVLPGLYIFYLIFTPLTVYPVYYLLDLFYEVTLSGPDMTNIILQGHTIKLVEACIAGSAYYLLLILNLTTPMKIRSRIFSLLFLFSSFLIVNILRIFSFSLLLLNSFSLFNFLHLVFWYGLSGVFVFLLWVANIKIFDIEKIPVYSDLKSLWKVIKES